MGLLASGSIPENQAEAAANAEFEAWRRTLLDKGELRVYRGEELQQIAMPMGGIGAGQIFLTGRGRLEQWQILNNFNSRANVPGSFFGIRAKPKDGKPVARLLQEGNLGEAQGVKNVEFSGEYPFAWLRYLDDELPVDVTLEAYSPFIPLNTKDSGLPAVVFNFTVRNRTNKPVDAALMASMPNLVGWDGYASLNELKHVDFIGNFNTFMPSPQPTLVMQTKEGTVHRMQEPRDLFTNDPNVAYLMRLCENLKVHFTDRMDPWRGTSQPERKVFWLGDTSAQFADSTLKDVLDAVEAGASLVIAGEADSLLALADSASTDSNAVVFENWESGTYSGWTIEGNCFGSAPATGTLPYQQRVSGWRGKHFVNTYVGGDGTTGRATSRPFKIEKRFIHLLVGGGSHRNQTCVNLKIDGQVVATATGENREHMRPIRWDVMSHSGKAGVIEIIDTHTGGWGHILVDDIIFSDSPASPFVDPGLVNRLREALPFRFHGMRPVEAPMPVSSSESSANALTQRVTYVQLWMLNDFRLRQGAIVLSRVGDVPVIIKGKYGKGFITVCTGSPVTWPQPKKAVGDLIAQASGTAYIPQTGWSKSSLPYGSMALVVIPNPSRDRQGAGSDISALEEWKSISDLWNDFVEDGTLTKTLSAKDAPPRSMQGESRSGALSVPLSLKPNEEKRVTFVLAWHFPNRTRDSRYGWGPPAYQYDHRLGNQYNNWFKDASDVVTYVSQNLQRLERETRLFHQTFYDSTLPRWFLDCLTANASLIRSPIMVWLEDGAFAGFEGADHCCPMNCTHVYNYVMSTAHLFPSLERNVRETDLKAQMHPTEHYIPHRTVLPLSLPRLQNQIGGPHHHALDGELGTILKTYREWKLSGDRKWLEGLWPNVKKVMQHVLRDHDLDGDGVFKGEQPNTYDIHTYGSNTFLGTLYLAALRATEEMAQLLRDEGLADECRIRFEKGRAGYDRICWNGEYYVNIYNAPAQSGSPLPLAGEGQGEGAIYNQNNCWGPGCHSDQLLGQWWANAVGLGYLLPRERVRQALQAMYFYNWRADLSNHQHRQRVFASGKEKGLLCCSWPKGGRPQNPILYCDEVWTGIEYHVAATMLREGMVSEALQIVKGARDRYTGNQRNPWAEVECGHHYSRAMSAHSLLLEAAGLAYDAATASLSFAPKLMADDFKAFFSTGSGWGSLTQKRSKKQQQNVVQASYGNVSLRLLTLDLPVEAGEGIKATVKVNGRARKAVSKFDGKQCELSFAQPVTLPAGQKLEVQIDWSAYA